MSESSEVEDGGVGSTDASAAESPIGGGGGGGGGGAPKKDSTLGHLELSRIWETLCRKLWEKSWKQCVIVVNRFSNMSWMIGQ